MKNSKYVWGKRAGLLKIFEFFAPDNYRNDAHAVLSTKVIERVGEEGPPVTARRQTYVKTIHLYQPIRRTLLHLTTRL